MRQQKIFLLKLWNDSTYHKDNWRASLEDLISKEKLNFASLEKLHECLEVLTELTEDALE